jgi:hypothetical protein
MFLKSCDAVRHTFSLGFASVDVDVHSSVVKEICRLTSTFDKREEIMTISFDPSIIIEIKSTEEELPQNEVKGEGLISCDK